MFIEVKSKEIIEKAELKPIFRVFQNSLIQDIYLGINKLFDPEFSYGHRNICFEFLISKIKKQMRTYQKHWKTSYRK